ncbi:MAG TPA: glycoside hydrolase family 2 TIM barrel-domain containing protein [Candidatus Dormibacteraeota bacterium]|nr:glycoside hydrolase family 2 TIM barrel-domain containing protein [Candidatus Dormibacteraeota bacterium]
MSGEVIPRPEYPRPDFRREEWANLNGEWEFGAGEKPVFDRRIMVPYCPESKLSGLGESPGDVVWYRRRFDAPPADRLVLHFGAVDYRATVWVNGVEVGRHQGGHTPFTADITAVAQRSDNVVLVRAEDALADKTIPRGKQFWGDRPEGIFYTPTTGIWQTVWLEPLPERHIESLHLFPDLAPGAVDLELAGEGQAELTVTYKGDVVGSWSGPAGRGRIALEHVLPWRPGWPELYRVEARLLDPDGRVVDRVTTYFGLRSVECRDGRFWLNGEPFVQRLVLDQGYFPGGLMTAPSAEDLRRDIELAKALGFNGARKHQKVEDPLWLYYADALGFLVWDEMPSFQAHSADAERRLVAEWAEVVRRDRGHPSVVAWVPANESFGLEHVKPEVRSRFLVQLYELTRGLDATRPVVSNDGWEHAVTDMCTLHDYTQPADFARRYRTLETALDGTASRHSAFENGYEYGGQPLLVTEFGGVQVSGAGGWGYSEVAGREQFLDVYRGLVEGLMDPGPVQGFCYTQLTDVEQEKNGLLTFEREWKVAPELARPITQTAKRD